MLPSEPQTPNPGTVAKDCVQTVCAFDSRNHLAINLAKVTCERERTAKSNSASNPPITLDDDDLIANDEKV